MEQAVNILIGHRYYMETMHGSFIITITDIRYSNTNYSVEIYGIEFSTKRKKVFLKEEIYFIQEDFLDVDLGL